MKKASISILKAQLSRYLDAVKSGEEVIVAERGRPVARLTGADPGATPTGRVATLVREGRIRSPTHPAPSDRLEAQGPPDAKGRSLELLLAERTEGR